MDSCGRCSGSYAANRPPALVRRTPRRGIVAGVGIARGVNVWQPPDGPSQNVTDGHSVILECDEKRAEKLWEGIQSRSTARQIQWYDSVEWCVRNIEDIAPQIDELVPVLAPGDSELECATRAVATGIEISDAGLESIKIAAELVGVAVFGIARTTIHAEQPHGLENCLDRSRPSYGTEV
jgi:hypothetical protein